ncbi:MAG: cysteine desulfurase [Deltaproteobacteria bacterium]|nr:cysteine desulfurase [Deltaproteobacteria bacterium]
MRGIYLDYNASTPIAPEVAAAMRPLLTEHFGNPSSGHWASRGATEALTWAREQVAALLGAQPTEIVFTSGGSESNNQAIKGVVTRALRERPDRRPHIICSAVEHPSVARVCAALEGIGAQLTTVGVDATGRVDPDQVAAAVTDDTVLITVMHANNEVGTIQPVAAIATLAKQRGILLHSDAAQSMGKVPVLVDDLGVDLLTVAGHKLYAPKGIGALYVREGVAIDSLIHGADHESGRRAGTESVLLAMGLGAACELARRDPCAAWLRELRDQFWERLRKAFGDRVQLNGHPTERLPNTLNVSFVGQQSHDLLTRLDGVAASTGSACHAGSRTVSGVLAAMGVADDVALGAIRFSLGRGNDLEQVERVVEWLGEALG